jgi:protein-tyrosine phosphatase
MRELLDKLKRVTARVTGGAPPVEEAARPDRAVLFVCMGNICRSPTAEGVFRRLLAEHAPDLHVLVDSAGTHAYHVGNAPDPRACRAAERRGVDLRPQRARQVNPADFERFDLILAMDRQNHAELLAICPPQLHGRVRLFLDFAPHLGRDEVPDPYYGGVNGFELVLDLVEEASLGLIEHLRRPAPPAEAGGARSGER